MENIALLGVYKVDADDDIVLIELEISEKPSAIDFMLFTQKDENLEPSSWQVAYDEHFLNESGTQIIDKLECVSDVTRVAFFLYFCDTAIPLTTPFGDLPLTIPVEMPDRLKSIIAFESVD